MGGGGGPAVGGPGWPALWAMGGLVSAETEAAAAANAAAVGLALGVRGGVGGCVLGAELGAPKRAADNIPEGLGLGGPGDLESRSW